LSNLDGPDGGVRHYAAAVVWEREQVSPEEVEAPNGVRAVEHRLAGESRVRAEEGASHTVDEDAREEERTGPVEVQVGAGALWVFVPPGGVEVQVNHGGFSALVSSGAAMVDAGEGRDGLLLVTAGEVLLVDAAGTSRVLSAGEAAVLGADGDLAGVDQVGEDELAGDPWAAANRALDDAVVVPEPELDDELAADDVAEPAAEEPEDEEPETVEGEDELEEETEEVPSPAIIEATAVETVAGEEPVETDEADAYDEDEGSDEDSGRPWLPPPPEETGRVDGELLDELYAPGEVEAHEVSGRSAARVLEVAALIVFVAVIVLLVFLFNQDDDKGGRTEIANTASTIRTTTSRRSTTTTSSTTSTTAVATTVNIHILSCSQKGEALVASGTVDGAPPSAKGYRITVVVQLDKRTFGRKTVTVERGDRADGRKKWTAEVPLNGDAVGAGADCKIPKGGVSLV
jgi:hypothetical protein